MKPHGNRPTLEWAKQKFRSAGVELLAEEYANQSTVMPYQCDKCQEVHYDSLANFCKRQKRGCEKRQTLSLESVQAYFKSHGCELIETVFVNSNTPMDYRCACGTIARTTFANFKHHNVRCFECGKNKIAGKNNYQWIEDREEGVRRSSREDRAWRTQVFQRDNYTCQCCGQRGKKLNAHHLFDYQNHRHLALDLDNGVTLCKDCHVSFHKKYGAKAVNTPDQFTAFKEARYG
jgi:5-methylcytosine-specific restriction endonuclease McrA